MERSEVVADRYRLLGELGAGGHGQVWKAFDEELRVEVALKAVALSGGSGPEKAERAARAQREARYAAQLRTHPHVVPVHDVVLHDGVPWIVMELVSGRTLQAEIDALGRLDPGRVLAIARALLEALAAAHERGIVHRDVKPANVMLAEDGRTLLTDFGIAVRDADTKLTDTGAVIGSAEYIAPERISSGDQGPPGDLFSLGVTLYQALAGYSPFHRDNAAATFGALLAYQPPPEPAGNLSGFVLGLLAKDPARRPTARQALALLPPAVETAPAEPTAKAGETVAAAAFGATELMDSPLAPPGPPNRPLGRRGLIGAGAAALCATAAVLAITLWPHAAGPGTRTHTQTSTLPDFLAGSNATVNTLAYSPDGSLLAAGSEDDTIRLWSAATRHLVAVLPAGAPVTSLAFSPDGKQLVSNGGTGDQALLWNLNTRRVTTTFAAADPIDSVAFSPDGTTVAVGAEDADIELWNTRTGHTDATFTTYDPSGITAEAFAPDGKHLATYTLSCYLQIWDVATHQGTVPPPNVDGSASAQISPDGTTLANGSHNSTDGPTQVQLWNAATARSAGGFDFSGRPSLAVDSANDWDVVYVAYSPNGRLLAAAADDGRVQIWTLSTNLTATTFTVPANVHGIAFSPDSTTVAVAQSNGHIELHKI